MMYNSTHSRMSDLQCDARCAEAVEAAELVCSLQVEKDMIEVLQQKWLEGHLAVLREEIRKYEK